MSGGVLGRLMRDESSGKCQPLPALRAKLLAESLYGREGHASEIANVVHVVAQVRAVRVLDLLLRGLHVSGDDVVPLDQRDEDRGDEGESCGDAGNGDLGTHQTGTTASHEIAMLPVTLAPVALMRVMVQPVLLALVTVGMRVLPAPEPVAFVTWTTGVYGANEVG